MPAFARLALTVFPLLGAAAASAVTDDTATCIAVMQLRADELAQQVRAGETGQEPALRTELERAATLIGRAYLDGLHDEAEARARLKAAQDAQAGKPPAERAAVHAACVRRADAEMEAASILQRFIVARIAQARLSRLLGPP